MRGEMSAFNNQRGKAFNESVAAVLEQVSARRVRARVTSVGTLKIPNDLGDVDVLTVDPEDRLVRVIECKDLALARTPDELSNQLSALLPTDDRDEGAATVRHRRRVKWVSDNVGSIVAHFGLPVDVNWRVIGVFVVDEPLFVSHLQSMSMPVVALEALRASKGTWPQESEPIG
jgi:hypothetical protein